MGIVSIVDTKMEESKREREREITVTFVNLEVCVRRFHRRRNTPIHVHSLDATQGESAARRR